MRISVAMATFNGAPYIGEQLDSLINQTRPPDELVVTDDGSTDGTLDIVQAYARRAPFDVHCERNKENLGYAMNFSKAMALCSGDIIFLSDQDDEWLPAKIDVVLSKMRENPLAQVVLNDMIICDENLVPSNFTQLNNILSAGRKAENFYSGCCMAVKRQFMDLVLPVPPMLFSHDNWINHLSLALNARLLIPTPLQKYRRHGRNASNWEMSDIQGTSQLKVIRSTGLNSSVRGWKDQVNRYELALDRILSEKLIVEGIGLKSNFHDALKSLDRRIQNLDARIRLAARPRTIRWLAVLALLKRGCYSDFAGWKSALKDAIRP